jgi:hypothetical protein
MNEALLQSLKSRPIRGGFTVRQIDVAVAPLIDALGREAIARTQILGKEFFVVIRAGLSDEELSVTIYHEILEAATVALADPPAAVRSFNEGDFESAAYRAFEQLGPASAERLDQMLQSYGF